MILGFVSVACSTRKKERTSFSRAAFSRGADGKSCWQAPGMNDRNGDGVNDAADCRYEIAKPVVYSSKNIVEFNEGPQVVLEVDQSENLEEFRS